MSDGPDPPDTIVVIPARDEAARIAGCIDALAAQTLGRDAFAVIVVLDRCHDQTGEVIRSRARAGGLELAMIPGPGLGSGAARRAGMELACQRLLEAGRPDALIASTDADTRPAPDWLERQRVHLAAGAEAVAGRVELDRAEAAQLPDGVLALRARDARQRLERTRRNDPDAEHHHFAGASLGVRAATYREVGGIEPRLALEDAAFAERLAAHDVRVVRPRDVVVTTSARADGRATRGLALDLAVANWFVSRRFAASRFTFDDLCAVRGNRRVTVIIPVKECAATIVGVIERTVMPAVLRGLVDELVVIDAASDDDSGALAAAAGARVIQQDEVAASSRPRSGKGDAMWRALLATGGEIVCFLDGDTRDPDPAHLLGLLGPLLTDPAIKLVKGAFDRPFDCGSELLTHEGGRVTELMARPLINLCEPRLAGFAQPLAGEFAANRELLESIPFPAGYGVEIATLIDSCRRQGLDALAECALGTRQNRHQSLVALGEMASEVLAAVDRRVAIGQCGPGVHAASPLASAGAGRFPGAPLERPPIATVRGQVPLAGARSGKAA